MLARLELVDGVRSVAIDHAGELLRLECAEPETLERVTGVLAELGYAGEELAETGVATDLRWHRGSGVRELSWEEAQVIARRVVPPFARRQRLEGPTAERLRDTVASALYECFVAHPLANTDAAGALRDACRRAVAQATAGLVGDDLARALGDALWEDAG